MMSLDLVFSWWLDGLPKQYAFRVIIVSLLGWALWLGGCNTTEPPLPPMIDTTDHNFAWDQPLSIGDGNSSTLYDVAIINDTLAYAVGEVYFLDSLGNWDPSAYNLVKWNGTIWEPHRIQFLTFCGQSSTGSYPAKAVLAIGESDVWISSGSQIARWDGKTQTSPECIPISVIKLWGESPSSVFAIGYAGGIAHYANSSWQKFSSGTTVDIQDIWGVRDSPMSPSTIIAVASFKSAVPQRMTLLKVQGTMISQVDTTGLPLNLNGVWADPIGGYYVVGDGVYHSQTLGPPWVAEKSIPPIYVDAIRGNGLNDIIVAGAFGLICHYNGMTWKNYLDAELTRFYGEYHAVSMKGNLVVAVGWRDDKAVALVGRRIGP